jgi:DNA invertase Pin-like site-specific DNA recombinase
MRRSAPGRTGRWKFGQEVSSALVELTQFFHVLASLAQMERELIVERPRAGLDAARRQGRVGGRRREMTESKVEAARKLLASGTPGGKRPGNIGSDHPHVKEGPDGAGPPEAP